MNRRKFVGGASLLPIAMSLPSNASPSASSPLMVFPDKSRVYDIGHGEARILVGAEQSNGAWWLGSLSSEPGRLTSLHVHHGMDEHFYVLEGTLSAWLDGRWWDLPVGAFASAPRGLPHALGNRTKNLVRFLAAGNPAGFEQFFGDIEILSRRIPYGKPEFLAELKKVYLKYDSELLGPAPES